jgi:hypothetical protein
LSALSAISLCEFGLVVGHREHFAILLNGLLSTMTPTPAFGDTLSTSEADFFTQNFVVKTTANCDG